MEGPALKKKKLFRPPDTLRENDKPTVGDVSVGSDSIGTPDSDSRAATSSLAKNLATKRESNPKSKTSWGSHFRKSASESSIKGARDDSQQSDGSRMQIDSVSVSGSRPSSQQSSQVAMVQLSQPPRGLTQRERLLWLQKRRECGLWVNCAYCSKWRYLKHESDPLTICGLWYCELNQGDDQQNSCDKPERKPTITEEEDFIHNAYNAGSVVWAKQEGFPWWPAIVDDDPEIEAYYWLEGISSIPTYYNVTFFDTKPVTRAWITPAFICKYKGNENAAEYNKSMEHGVSYRERKRLAKQDANRALKMTLSERLQMFSFISRYKGPIIKRDEEQFVPERIFKPKETKGVAVVLESGKSASRKPAMETPAIIKPALIKNALEKPALGKHVSRKQAFEKSVSTQELAFEEPTSSMPALEKTASRKPALEKPASRKPAEETLAFRKAALIKNVLEKPALEKNASRKRAFEKPSSKEEPALEEPTSSVPAVKKTDSRKSASENPVSKKPAMETPSFRKAALIKNVLEKPALGKHTSRKHVFEKPTFIQEPALEEPTSSMPAVEKNDSRKPALEKPASGKLAMEKPVPKRSALEKTASSKPATEKPVFRKPAWIENAPALEKPASRKPALKKTVPKTTALEKPACRKTASRKVAVMSETTMKRLTDTLDEIVSRYAEESEMDSEFQDYSEDMFHGMDSPSNNYDISEAVVPHSDY